MNEIINVVVNGNEYSFSLEEIREKKTIVLNEDFQDPNGYYEVVNRDEGVFFLFSRKHHLYVTTDLNRIYRRRSRLLTAITKNYTWFFGYFKNLDREFEDCDNVFLNKEHVGTVIRPFRSVPKLRHLAIIRVRNEDIINTGEIHNTVKVGKSFVESLHLSVPKKSPGMAYKARKRINDRYLLVRTTLGSRSVRITHIPMRPEYTTVNMIKNSLASFISKFIGSRKIVLMFEKETNKANESGYYIFDKIMKREDVKALAYFVINKNSPDYDKVKKAHPNNTIDKYSFKHYLYIYISKYFISSELSNHVINPRLYISSINDVIREKPLVFLQHGIMFAKPVDNPAASGFRKENGSVNFYKCVISSELEAEQFFKLGFSRDDLIKCGLTKFDISYQAPDADKVMFMPTYRYWEEGQVMDPRKIKDTTYYKNYMTVIEKFREEGLLDRLIISCHPKFADCLITADPIYEGIIEKDINRGLESAKVFITDYSSASYDAHYRGAYIIYYWAEKEYLIENYKAYPPVDETNCDGVPVYDVDSLINEVKKAISVDFKMDEIYEERYRRINEFHDGKNGDRLIDELIRLEVL